jgi:hypothetical protein
MWLTLLKALCDSAAMTVLVLVLVLIQIAMIATDKHDPFFDVFTTIFFTVEVSLRLYAHGRDAFFFGEISPKMAKQPQAVQSLCKVKWLNVIDLVIVIVDILIIFMSLFLSNVAGLAKFAKSGRAARMLKLSKFARVFRMHRLAKVMWEVLTRKPNEWVQARRVEINNIVKHTDLSGDLFSPPDTKVAEDEQETDEISHRKLRRQLQRQGDELVRKRFRTIKRDGTTIRVPVIGEKGGKKVRFWSTTVLDICHDFGLGTGMYFFALKTFGSMFAVITLINIVNMLYFNSHFASTGLTIDEQLTQKFGDAANISATDAVLYAKSAILMGTAVCYDTEAVMVLQNTSGGLAVEHHNACKLGMVQVATGSCVLAVLIGALVYFQVSFKALLKEVIESDQTACNYSVSIDDPSGAALSYTPLIHSLTHRRSIRHRNPNG